MHIEAIREYALGLPEVEECTPFGPDTLVYKTAGRMFLLLPLDEEDLRFNVKCDPDLALELRERYPEAVLPGYHMNKANWNTVVAGKGLPDNELLHHIRASYELIRATKPKKPKG